MHAVNQYMLCSNKDAASSSCSLCRQAGSSRSASVPDDMAPTLRIAFGHVKRQASACAEGNNAAL